MTEKGEKKQFYCPYCDEEIVKAELPFCKTCGMVIFYCPQCRKPLARENKICPHCGADIKGKATKES